MIPETIINETRNILSSKTSPHVVEFYDNVRNRWNEACEKNNHNDIGKYYRLLTIMQFTAFYLRDNQSEFEGIRVEGDDVIITLDFQEGIKND